jgi:hypothetical protein
MAVSKVPAAFRCRCARHRLPCNDRATQEDMRCDLCRKGECSLLAIGPHDAPVKWMHVKMVTWKAAFPVPAGH